MELFERFNLMPPSPFYPPDFIIQSFIAIHADRYKKFRRFEFRNFGRRRYNAFR